MIASCRDPDGPAVIVDPYSSGAQLAPEFRAAGVRPIAVMTAAQPPDVYASSFRPDDFDHIIVDDGTLDPYGRATGRTSTVDAVRALRPRCVIVGCESGVLLGDHLAAETVPDVANDPVLAQARRHKGAMGEAVKNSGLASIPQICTSSLAEVDRWLDDTDLVGADLVIKPPLSASSDGVTKVSDGVGWEAIFGSLLGATNRLGICNTELVVQQCVSGTEYVVDTVSFGGTHTVTNVCRYRKVVNGPHMAVYDSMTWLSATAPELATLIPYAQGVLDAVGIRYGAAHIELMLTADGPRLIEVGARAHGGGHPRFCMLATGDSQVARTVRAFTDPAPLPELYELQRHTKVVFHMSTRAGRISGTDALDSIDELPSCVFATRHIHDGDQVPVTSTLFDSLDLGFAVLSDQHERQVDADHGRIRDLESTLSYSSSEVAV